MDGFTLNAMAKKFDKIFTDSIKKEKEKKPSHPINSYMEYNLAIESIFIDYFFTVKNYLEQNLVFIMIQRKSQEKRKIILFQKKNIKSIK